MSDNHGASSVLGPKRLAIFVLVGLLLFPASGVSSAGINGTKCPKLNKTRAKYGVRYVCVKSGKQLRWRVVKTQDSRPSSTTSSIPKAQAPEAQVAAKINDSVEPMRKRSQRVPSVEYRFGPSVSSSDQALTRELTEAFFKYGSFPQLANFRNAISVSLSLEEAIQTTAEFQNISSWGAVAGAYTGTGTYSLVIQDFTAHRCGNGTRPSDCAARDNGGATGRFRVRVNVLHELSHGGKVAVMGYDPSSINNHLNRLPMWLASGISNVHGAMVLAVIDNSSYSNLAVTASDVARCAKVPISLASMTDTPGEGGWGCKGMGTGDLANELLVARFGLDRVLEFIANLRDTPPKDTWTHWSDPWAKQFQETFLQTPAAFERDVETYRTAVIQRMSLPDGFLDAKSRL